MSEAKTPLPGEYWVSDDGSIIRIVGVKLNGGVIYENQAGLSFQLNSMTNWRHEPRCTGFDWTEPQPPDPGEGYEVLPDGEVLQEGDQFEAIGKWRNTNNAGRKTLPGWTYRRKIKPVETWPKYYTSVIDSPHYYRLDSMFGGWCVEDGKDTEIVANPYKIMNTPNVWREITEAEAPAPVTPVESPNDWVEITDRDHKLRHGIDQFNTCIWRRDWGYVYDSCGKTVTQAGFKSARCRRRDLPVPMQSVAEVCEPAVKRVPVRLFLDDRNNMFAVRGEWPIVVGTQIKHDAGGFYVVEEAE